MRKYFITILLLMIFMPFIVNAEELCTIVSGNGKDIGSEIACGSEHFYIIENNDDSIKMLAKYNLYVGFNYNKIKLDINKTYVTNECDEYSCSNDIAYYFEGEQVSSYDEWENKIKEKYNLDGLILLKNDNGYLKVSNGNQALYLVESSDKYVANDKTYQYTTYKLYPYTTITKNTEGYALQNKLALGVTGEKGNANYPLYATLSLFNTTFQLSDFIDNYDNFENGYTNFEFKENTYVKKNLDDYKTKLNNMGYGVSNVDMINIKEINDLVYAISNKNLPLTEWYNLSLNSESNEEDYNKYYTLGDLKEYLSSDYA